MRILILCVLLAATSVAHALMPPHVYQRAREEAPYHVQVAIERVKEPSVSPGACRLDGKIVRIFRDTAKDLRDGAPVTLFVSCMRGGDRIAPGGTLWTNLDALKQARFLEAYLNAERMIALWQSRIIAAPSDAPQMK